MNDKSKFIKKISGITTNLDQTVALTVKIRNNLLKEVEETEDTLSIKGTVIMNGGKILLDARNVAISSLMDAMELKQETFGNPFLPGEYAAMMNRLYTAAVDIQARANFRALFPVNAKEPAMGLIFAIQVDCSKNSNPHVIVRIMARDHDRKKTTPYKTLFLVAEVENI